MQFPLQKKRTVPPIDKSKYCKFHRDYCHDTNDCVMLKDEIKKLIRRGKLVKYRHYGDREVEEGRTRELERSRLPRLREVSSKTDQVEQQILGMVEIISGGFAGRGE